MMKADFGVFLVFIMTTYLYESNHRIWIAVDTIIGISLFVNIYLMRNALRQELKLRAILIFAMRIFLEGYIIYRVHYFVNGENVDEVDHKVIEQYRGVMWIMLGGGCLNLLTLIMLTLSTVMCILNFGKGLKEMLIKQNQGTNSTQLSEMA